MNTIPTIVLSFPNRSLLFLPTSCLHLEVGHHRRYAYAYSTRTQDPTRS